MMISCTPVFGGAGVANQISELKRGTEVRVLLVAPLDRQLLLTVCLHPGLALGSWAYCVCAPVYSSVTAHVITLTSFGALNLSGGAFGTHLLRHYLGGLVALANPGLTPVF